MDEWPTDPMQMWLSECHEAPLKPAHDDPHEGQTNYFVCSECGKHCGIIDAKDAGISDDSV